MDGTPRLPYEILFTAEGLPTVQREKFHTRGIMPSVDPELNGWLAVSDSRVDRDWYGALSRLSRENLHKSQWKVFGFVLAITVAACGGTIAIEVLDPLNSKIPLVIEDLLQQLWTSMAAGLVFYWLLQRHVEPSLIEVASVKGANAGHEFYSKHVRRFIPSSMYNQSDGWDDRLISDYYNTLVTASVYKYKGDTAKTTSYELWSKWTREDRFKAQPREYRFILAFPNLQLYTWRARYELLAKKRKPDHATVVERANEMIEELFETLVALYYSAKDESRKANVTVVLYDEPPFYRCEIMEEKGAFLTYYSHGRYSETFFYEWDTVIAKAINLHFSLIYTEARDYAEAVQPVDGRGMSVAWLLRFNNQSYTEDQLIQDLERLGCKKTLEALKQAVQARYKESLAHENAERAEVGLSALKYSRDWEKLP
ncbi:MAG TPA: hypothetical protein VF142_18080 [Longimicrobium sp.]